MDSHAREKGRNNAKLFPTKVIRMEILSKSTKELLRHPEAVKIIHQLVNGDFNEATITVDNQTITLRRFIG